MRYEFKTDKISNELDCSVARHRNGPGVSPDRPRSPPCCNLQPNMKSRHDMTIDSWHLIIDGCLLTIDDCILIIDNFLLIFDSWLVLTIDDGHWYLVFNSCYLIIDSCLFNIWQLASATCNLYLTIDDSHLTRMIGCKQMHLLYPPSHLASAMYCHSSVE